MDSYIKRWRCYYDKVKSDRLHCYRCNRMVKTVVGTFTSKYGGVQGWCLRCIIIHGVFKL